MPHLELKLQHYQAIARFMEEVELEPPDKMDAIEEESLTLVRQIIANIEKTRTRPREQKKPHQHKYRRGRAA